MRILWLNWLIVKLKLSPSFLFLFYDILYIYSGRRNHWTHTYLRYCVLVY